MYNLEDELSLIGISFFRWTLLQKIFNPLYNIFAYGCNITRDYTGEITSVGFNIVECKIHKAGIYPRMLVGYLYEGIAEKRED